MAREFAKIKAAIWQDDDFRELTTNEQHLYFLVLTDPELSYCGVADWRPRRMLPKAAGWTLEDLYEAGAALTERKLLIVDEETEEVLVRSFLRHDGVMQHNKLCVSAARAYAAVASNTLRGVIVHELRRLQDEFPEWPSWGRQQVQEVLKRNPLAPELAAPLAPGLAPKLAPGLGANASERLGVPYNSNSNSNSNSTTQPDRGATKTRATRLPDDWTPTDEHHDRARRESVDIERELVKFRAWADEGEVTSKSWNQRFTRWLMNAAEYAPQQPQRPRQQQRTGEAALQPWMFN